MKDKRFLIIAMLMIATLLAGCGADGSDSVVRTVITEPVAYTREGSSEVFSGNVVPVESAKLSFKLSGNLEGVKVSEGDFISKGQEIASLEAGDYNLAEKSAKAVLQSTRMKIDSEIPAKTAQAKAQLDLTQVTYDRAKALYEEGAIAKAQLDEAEAKLSVDRNTYQQAVDAAGIAETELGQAQAGYDLAVSNLESTKLYSPMSGIVLKKMATGGEVISAGYPVVVVGKIDQVWVEIGVPDAVVSSIGIGQAAEVYVYGQNDAFLGVVDEIGAVADETTRMFTVRLLVQNSEHLLKPGMIARASLVSEGEENIYVPFSSVVHLSGEEVVFLYDEDSGTVHKQSVETGALIGEKVEIKAGLTEGDILVVEGQYQVHDGEKVQLRD